jgi:hypothetical protein
MDFGIKNRERPKANNKERVGYAVFGCFGLLLADFF